MRIFSTYHNIILYIILESDLIKSDADASDFLKFL